VSAIDDARKCLGAASASNDRGLRIIYSAEARLHMANALAELASLQLHLDAIEAELVRTAPAKTGRDA
jgi:hypothetical protein